MKQQSEILAIMTEHKSKFGNTFYIGKTDTNLKLTLTRNKTKRGVYEWILKAENIVNNKD
jgi:hypothetical protein